MNTGHDSQWYRFVVSNTHQLYFINSYTTFADQNFHGWSWNWTTPLTTSNSLFYLHEVLRCMDWYCYPLVGSLFVTILSWFSKGGEESEALILLLSNCPCPTSWDSELPLYLSIHLLKNTAEVFFPVISHLCIRNWKDEEILHQRNPDVFKDWKYTIPICELPKRQTL